MGDTMPLSEKSPNIPSDSESVCRKRSHDEFSDAVKLSSEHEAKRPSSSSTACQNHPLPAPVQAIVNDSTPNTSPALTDGGNTATSNSSPPTPSKSTSPPTSTQDMAKPNSATASAAPATASAAPPKKRTKLTPAEREAREKEAEQKKKEREEKQKIVDEEKRRKAEEKEVKRLQREEEREEKRKKKEEEDKIKAQKAQEKESKKREAQEAKEKEERKQSRLKSFFTAPTTPKKAPVTVKQESSPEKTASAADTIDSEYQKRFQPFFVKENTSMAPNQMDEETRTVKSSILNEYFDGKRSHDPERSPFDAVSLFTLPGKPEPRGKVHHPVRHIMEKAYNADGPGDQDTMKDARKTLSNVPMKVIAFSQDVRPPYFGTVTFKPFALGKQHMCRLAKKSTGKLLPLDYDYDSEAEWQEEEGEDLDADDDEEEIDDEDDMDGFLDDSDDAGPARIFANALEPESTGVCYMGDGQEPSSIILQHKMEIIMDNIDCHMGLDPWNSSYWEPEAKSLPANTNASKMPPPVGPTNAFAAMRTSNPAVKLVKPEIINDVKQVIVDNKDLSKVGIIEVLYQRFRVSASRTEVKNTFEAVAEKSGSGRSKEWVLKPGCQIA